MSSYALFLRSSPTLAVTASLFISTPVLAAEQGVALQEVVVTAKRRDEGEPTRQTLELLKVPGTFGDPLQAIYSLPGVVQSSEEGGQPAVRGSGPEDNAYLIDNLPASYVFHDLGNSIFEESLLKDFGLQMAGFGARYGKATGGLFDIRLRDPRREAMTYTLDVSALRATGMVEGAITKNQAFYASYRESLYHLLLPALADDIQKEDDIRFEKYPRARDFQAKYVWDIDDHQRLSLLTIGAQDLASVRFGTTSDEALLDPGSTGTSSIDTRFASQALGWQHLGASSRTNVDLGYLTESRRDRRGGSREYIDIDTAEWTLKARHEVSLGRGHQVTAGADLQDQTYDYAVDARYRSCTQFSPECATDPGEFVRAADQKVVRSGAAYLEDTYSPSASWSLTGGVRYSVDQYLDETHVEPRVAVSRTLDNGWKLNGSWGRYHQPPQIVQSVPVFGNPDLLSPRATHYVFGVASAPDHRYTWNADVYYKALDRVVVDTDDGSLYRNAASGEAYGAELMVRRNLLTGSDRFYGWATLSYSKTERENDLTGSAIRFDYDTPIVANLVGQYRINSRWSAGLRWAFRSGYPYTPIIGNAPNPDFAGYYLPVYGELNSERASAYHRLDLRFERQFSGTRYEGSYYFDLVNAYGRKNGGSVVYEPVAGSSDYVLKERESLPLMPSFGVRISLR